MSWEKVTAAVVVPLNGKFYLLSNSASNNTSPRTPEWGVGANGRDSLTAVRASIRESIEEGNWQRTFNHADNKVADAAWAAKLENCPVKDVARLTGAQRRALDWVAASNNLDYDTLEPLNIAPRELLAYYVEKAFVNSDVGREVAKLVNAATPDTPLGLRATYAYFDEGDIYDCPGVPARTLCPEVAAFKTARSEAVDWGRSRRAQERLISLARNDPEFSKIKSPAVSAAKVIKDGPAAGQFVSAAMRKDVLGLDVDSTFLFAPDAAAAEALAKAVVAAAFNKNIPMEDAKKQVLAEQARAVAKPAKSTDRGGIGE